uniref:Uncharacterized protein n=1 Tax=Anguilla anguilla TaxID=7936 RepID=A0A0E9WD23_ANGAN
MLDCLLTDNHHNTCEHFPLMIYFIGSLKSYVQTGTHFLKIGLKC